MKTEKNIRIAIVQTGSVMFDRQGSIEKACKWISEAGKTHPAIILFPEAFIPGYPRGLTFGTRIGSRSDQGKVLWERYYRNAVDLNGADLDPVRREAGKAGCFVSLGIVERSGGSLYCTQVLISPDGKIAGWHRKLKPTGTERVIWAEGDGSTLTTFKTSFGIIGTLICWENFMPAARMAMYRQGVTIYLAPTADQRDLWPVSMRHIAAEGRCYVLSANQFIRPENYPQDILETDHPNPEDLYCRGGSLVANPSGEIIAGPLYDREGILTAELDPGAVVRGKMDLDVAGHYDRKDIFRFSVPDQPDTLETGF